MFSPKGITKPSKLKFSCITPSVKDVLLEIYLIGILYPYNHIKIEIEIQPQTHCSKQVDDMKSLAISHAQMAKETVFEFNLSFRLNLSLYLPLQLDASSLP